jgi:uridine kinase
MKKLILIRGLPGSGKSTIARQIVEESPNSRVHLEADMYFINNEGMYIFDVDKLSSAHSWCLNSTLKYLQNDLPGIDCIDTVVVSNTFTTHKELKPYYAIADSLNVPVEEIVCTGEYGSLHNVPPDTMSKMRKRFNKNPYRV